MTKQSTIHLWIRWPIATLIGPEASATQRTVQDFLSGVHRWSADDNEQVCEIASVTTASQPVGAMFDYLLTDQGEMPPDRKVVFKTREIGLAGSGMNTVDLLVVAQGAPVERFTVGENSGVRRLLELTNGTGLYSLAERDDQLRAGTRDVSTAQPIWEREVPGRIEQKWGHAVPSLRRDRGRGRWRAPDARGAAAALQRSGHHSR